MGDRQETGKGSNNVTETAEDYRYGELFIIELTDSIITIRPYTMENAQEHLAGEDEELVRWLSGGKGTLDGVQQWIEKNLEFWTNDGPIYSFAIFDRSDKLVGMVEANTDYQNVEGICEGEANISYGLFPQARRRGYATRAVNLITKFLEAKSVSRAIIRVDPKNLASLRIPNKCGFVRERTITTKESGQLVIFARNMSK